MSSEHQSWSLLVAAIETQVSDVRAQLRDVPKDSELERWQDVLGFEVPAALLALYRATNGLDLSGYLPDQFAVGPQLSFSLLPRDELASELMTQRENATERGGGKWKTSFVPFASDGGGSVQFVCGKREGLRLAAGSVWQYDPSDDLRKCAGSIDEYLGQVAQGIADDRLKVFDFRPKK